MQNQKEEIELWFSYTPSDNEVFGIEELEGVELLDV